MRRMLTEEVLFNKILDEVIVARYILDNINDYDYFEMLLIDAVYDDSKSKYAKVINKDYDWQIRIDEATLYNDGELAVSVSYENVNKLRLIIIGGKY